MCPAANTETLRRIFVIYNYKRTLSCATQGRPVKVAKDGIVPLMNGFDKTRLLLLPTLILFKNRSDSTL
jgi:hypothetical protein